MNIFSWHFNHLARLKTFNGEIIELSLLSNYFLHITGQFTILLESIKWTMNDHTIWMYAHFTNHSPLHNVNFMPFIYATARVIKCLTSFCFCWFCSGNSRGLQIFQCSHFHYFLHPLLTAIVASNINYNFQNFRRRCFPFALSFTLANLYKKLFSTTFRILFQVPLPTPFISRTQKYMKDLRRRFVKLAASSTVLLINNGVLRIEKIWKDLKRNRGIFRAC